MKKILLLVILFSYKISFSQLINPPIDIKSPTASNLGKYGDIPVSYHNGTTNINIPLYSISEEGIPLDISLSYDSSGIRVNSVASWVGQNWSLNAGGVITRTIRDKKDVRNVNIVWAGHNVSFKGFKHSGHRLKKTNWNSVSYLSALVNESIIYKKDNPYRNMDLEPDIFTFNFLGITGKFFLDNDGNWRVQSNSKLKIETFERPTPNLFDDRFDGTINEPSLEERNDIGKIIITDEKGNKYIFGNNDSHIEYFLAPKATETANAWYLSSVINNKNQVVYLFDYERLENITHIYRTRHFKIASCLSDKGNAYTLVDDRTRKIKQFRSKTIMPVYLKKITTRSGNYIDFQISNLKQKPYKNYFSSTDLKSYQWKKLNYIRVFNYNNRLIKSLNLEYFPLGNNKRLNLKSVKELTNNNEELTLYSFEYDMFNQFPDYLSKKIDKWGFYNGRDFIVRQMNYKGWNWALGQSPPLVYFSEHDPSSASDQKYSLKGMLKKIIYPTKGFTSFFYEAHNASKKVNNNKQLVSYNSSLTIGGARIKRIEKHSLSSPVEIITYEYEGGVLMHDFTSFIPNWQSGNDSGGSYVFDINNLFPLSNINGSHIQYSKVIERYNDNSSIAYLYTDYNAYPDTAYEGTLNKNQSIFNKGTDRSLLRGKLIEIQKRNSNNVLKEKIKYDYLNVNLNPYSEKYVRAFEYTQPSLCNASNSFGNAYKLFYMDYDITKETTTTYLDNGKTMRNYITYSYNEDSLVSEISTLNSSNQVNTIKYKYPRDYRFEQTEIIVNPFNSYEVTHKNVYADMVDKHMLNYPIEILKSNDHATLSSEVISYKKSSGIINKSKYNKLENAINLPLSFSGATANNLNELTLDGGLTERFIYDKYDNEGNLEMYHKKDGRYTVLIWGYKKTQVIAKIDNKSSYKLK